ncbi:MAG: phage major tail tube protein [Deferribacterales bacterium]
MGKNTNLLSGPVDAFIVYRGDTSMLGVAEFTGPDIERMKETQKLAGVMGELDFVTRSLKAMTAKMKFSSTNGLTYELAEPGNQEIELRAVIISYDKGETEYTETGQVIRINAENTKAPVGKFATGNNMDAEYEFSVHSLKVTIDDEDVTQIDPANFIYKINGTDYMENYRSLLGMN